MRADSDRRRSPRQATVIEGARLPVDLGRGGASRGPCRARWLGRLVLIVEGSEEVRLRLRKAGDLHDPAQRHHRQLPTPALTLQALSSLAGELDPARHRAVVVDNDSRDGSAEAI